MTTTTYRPKTRSIAAQHAEWISLLQSSGPFLSVPVLCNTDGFQQGLPQSDADADLRRELAAYFDQWLANRELRRPDPAIERAWFKVVIEDVLEWGEYAREGQRIPPGLSFTHAETRETITPDLVFQNPEDGDDPGKVRLLVQRYPAAQALGKPVLNSRWSESPASRMAELLHHTNIRLGLVTNGEEWMLVNAPVGEPTGFTSWLAGLWFEEPVTFAAFRALLGVQRLIGVGDDQTIEAMLKRSAEEQAEVSVQLGDQVRQAIELLVDAIDREDATRHGALLAGIPDEAVYESAITVMMRLVFLLFAEDQQPPLFGDNDGIYDQHYSISGLIQQLEETEARSGQEILEQKKDAWSRLLATFRLVFAGSDHDHMRQPAYGGSLFDPDRFPFLEGREPGSRWDDTPARPLPINNRTVLHMLQAIQYLEIKGLNERQRISFRALDIEQIGHVYEQLLEHTARRADGPVLALTGTTKKGVKDEPEIALSDLEAWRSNGEAELLKQLKEATGRSDSALKKALAVEPDIFQQQKLRTACVTDEVYRRVLPFAGLIREDRAGRPLVIRPGGLYVTAGSDRRTTGAHYTPRSLTEPIVQYTLEPLIYDGPAEGKPREEWKLHPAKALLELTICDPAMGSGGFLVQACRYLSERLVEAWEIAGGEAAGVPANGAGELHIAPDGSLSRGNPGEQLLPRDRGERLAIARRLVADHCLYGVDVNPLAVDMAKLSLWLVTLHKDRPFTFLDHRLRCGDSLLGIGSIDQLRYFDLGGKPETGKVMFSASIDRYLNYAVEERRRIEEMPALDARQIAAKARRFTALQQTMRGLQIMADLLLGTGLVDKKRRDLRRAGAYQDATLLANLLPDATGSEFRTEHVQAMLDEYKSKATPWLDGKRPFHWPLEFPEVFFSSSGSESAGGFSAIIGNPPFLGGKKLTGAFGSDYRDFLVDYLANGQRGSADLCAYFVLRSGQLLRRGGAMGMIATNTIAQGDTREVSLDWLAAVGFSISRAVRSRPWPGAAALEVAQLWVINSRWDGEYNLDAEQVIGITPYLTKPGRASGNPYRLAANAGKSFVGSYVLGTGFLLQPEEATQLIALAARNRDVLFPYLSGEDFGSRPDQSPSRWVINFHDWPIERAEQYSEPFGIIERKVKPERQRKNEDGTFVLRRPLPERWWQYADKRPELYRTIADFDRVVVTAAVSSQAAFGLVENGIVFNHKIIVFAASNEGMTGLLQSSIHRAWIDQYTSTLGGAAINYSPSDCFETFPIPELELLQRVSSRYLEFRSLVMSDKQEGLTQIYRRMRSDEETTDQFVRFREEQVALDISVLGAYGWNDLDLEHDFHETKQGIRFTISEAARREVLDRLLELNHQRDAEEVAQGLHQKGGKGKAKRGTARQSALL